jgi:isopentenyl diphosphate isomerase/L-lactate dehydrogenase-like FMN-dependent dehydrogenase
MDRLSRAASIEDLRGLARRHLPKLVFDFIDGGAGDERTLRDNRREFDNWILMPRVGIDVSKRSLDATILGRPASLPLIFAPTGLAGLFRPGGERLGAQAAAEAGVPYCLSTNSIASIEQVAEAAPRGERWFQLYMLRDKGLMQRMLDRAAGSGYRVLCLTVDLATQGKRERDVRNAFTIPLRPHPRTVWDIATRPQWLYGVMRNPVSFGNFEGGTKGATSVAQHIATLFDPSATWDDFARIRENWRGDFIVKGILHPDDARRAVDIGAAAVVVSNHGGRQLDQVPASCSALPAIVDAVGGRTEIMIDGGIRRGTDILKALALGASSCMIGRPFLWGLAAGGGPGIARALQMYRDELDNAMALLGVCALRDVARHHIQPRGAGR